MRFVMGKKGTSKIKKYVDSGGYLFSEDWAIEEIIEPEWSDVLGHTLYLSEREVPVLPRPGAGTHPYLRKIFVKPPTKENRHGTNVEEDVSKLNYLWKIDKESPAIAIRNKQRVTVLMFSEKLTEECVKQGSSDAVAVTWISGGKEQNEPEPVQTGQPIPQDVAKMKGGRVLHMLSHFGKQSGTAGGAKGEYSLTNLLINFLIEANERRLGQK